MLDYGYNATYSHFWKSHISNFKKTHYLFIQYPNNTYILVHWNPLENGEKIHNFFGHFNNSK
jgi:hypothetical protein